MFGQNPTVRTATEIAVEYHTAVPDPLFRAYLYADSAIESLTDLQNFTGDISMPASNLTDVTGIEYAKNVARIYLYNNPITSLPVAALRTVTNVTAYSTNITRFEGDNMTALTYLNLASSPVTYANVTNLVNLTVLGLASTQVTSIDVGGLVNLATLSLGSAQFTQAALEAIIDDVWTNRVALGGNSCNITLTSNPGSSAAAASRASEIIDINASGCTLTI